MCYNIYINGESSIFLTHAHDVEDIEMNEEKLKKDNELKAKYEPLIIKGKQQLENRIREVIPLNEKFEITLVNPNGEKSAYIKIIKPIVEKIIKERQNIGKLNDVLKSDSLVIPLEGLIPSPSQADVPKIDTSKGVELFLNIKKLMKFFKFSLNSLTEILDLNSLQQEAEKRTEIYKDYLILKKQADDHLKAITGVDVKKEETNSLNNGQTWSPFFEQNAILDGYLD